MVCTHPKQFSRCRCITVDGRQLNVGALFIRQLRVHARHVTRTYMSTCTCICSRRWLPCTSPNAPCLHNHHATGNGRYTISVPTPCTPMRGSQMCTVLSRFSVFAASTLDKCAPLMCAHVIHTADYRRCTGSPPMLPKAKHATSMLYCLCVATVMLLLQS